MKIFSAGEAARALGVTRDQIQVARKNGIPKNPIEIGGRYHCDEQGMEELFEYFSNRGVAVINPIQDVSTTPI